jgi:hypothetical protein
MIVILAQLLSSAFAQVSNRNAKLPREIRAKMAKQFEKLYKLPDESGIDDVPQDTTIAKPPQDDHKGNVTPGGSAVGIVLLEEKNELYLDATPCQRFVARKQIITFRRPYKKETQKEKACGEGQFRYHAIKVTQQGNKRKR